MNHRTLLLLLLALALLPGCHSSSSSSGDDDTDTGTDSDTDTDTDVDTDTDTDKDTASDTDTDTDTPSATESPLMEPCDGGYLDPATNLCWQNPPSDFWMDWYDASGTAHPDYNPDGAIDYCGDGTWGEHDDWRLPDIDELITLMRGCVDGSATGGLHTSNCGVEDPGCLESSCSDGADCDWCSYEDGPGDDNCYWDPGISGECSWYWSSSLCNFGLAWLVQFDPGGVYEYYTDVFCYVRCVRPGP